MVVSLSFSIFFVCTCMSKLIHLYTYAGTVSSIAFILFLPSVLLLDIVVICLSRLFLSRKSTAITYITRLLACVFSLFLLGATAFYAAFYYETGTEVNWASAQRYVRDKDGIKLLMSGSSSALICVLLIAGTSWFCREFLYQRTGQFLNTARTLPLRAPEIWSLWKRRLGYRGVVDACDHHSSIDSTIGSRNHRKARLHLTHEADIEHPQKYSTILILSVFFYLALTASLRPSSPYSEMSASLPITMLQMLSSRTNGQASGHTSSGNPWPLPHLIEKANWEKPKGHFNGWAPGDDSIVAQIYRDRVPGWLPEIPPAGFCKWTLLNRPTQMDRKEGDAGGIDRVCDKVEAPGMFYNPVSDPLRITNQDQEILDILSDALINGTVKIKHVAVIMLESTREELFPLQHGSDIHNTILKSHERRRNDNDVNSILSQLTPVAEKITGKPGCWKKSDGSDLAKVPTPEWNDTTQTGYGGINVVGGLTTSSLSFKSFAATHCGVWPMPVDSFEESEAQSYQPCIPQILHLFNQMKGDTPSTDFLEQKWLTSFFQSITDKYDRQHKFNKQIGFEEIVSKDVLEQMAGAQSGLEEINYFGYPETALKKHVQGLIRKVKRENKRMFFSHFTSTTHHPWGLPDDFKMVEYANTQGKMSWHKDFNSYLNTVRFADAWLGELLQLFEDHGIANETLVVLVGDHGQAFREDIATRTGTYKNGHVSNFRVPITFRHPHIPRIQHEANTTSISILPTILDLLINTGSLNRKDTVIASDLVHDYEGQSLIRPYKNSQDGRRVWNFGVVNSGASMLSVTSADAPWRLVIPLDRTSQWRLTDLKSDPLELEPLEKWSMERLVSDARSLYGEEASRWVVEADAVAQWWAWERKRLWGHKTTR